jgi:hypothetical protein
MAGKTIPCVTSVTDFFQCVKAPDKDTTNMGMAGRLPASEAGFPLSKDEND